MKIAMFTDVYLEVPGGIGSSISAMKKSLETEGHEVKILCPGWHEEKDKSIIVVPTLKFFRPNGAPWGRRPSVIFKWLLENHPEITNFDLFHAHYEGPVSLAAIKIAKMYHISLVQTLHGREDRALRCNTPVGTQSLVSAVLAGLQAKSLRKMGLKPIKLAKSHLEKPQKFPDYAPKTETRGALRMWQIMINQAAPADLLILPAEHLRQKLAKFGAKLPETHILPNSIDDDIVPLQPQIRHWDPAKEPLELTWNSRLSHEKRFLPLLKGLKIARDRGLDFRLTAYGTGNDAKPAHRYAKKHHLNVTFLGNAARSATLRAIAKAHLSAIASFNFDVHSLTLVEAEACGTPLFICDPDMVSSLPKNSFILSPTPSPESIALALLDLEKHPEKIQQMSETMLSHRAEIYQSARIKQLTTIYTNLIKEVKNGQSKSN